MPKPNETQKIRLAQAKGALTAIGGLVLLVASIVIPAGLHNYVQTCNVTEHYSDTYTPSGDAKCTVATYVSQFGWLGILLGIISLIGGVILFFYAHRQDVREEFDAE